MGSLAEALRGRLGHLERYPPRDLIGPGLGNPEHTPSNKGLLLHTNEASRLLTYRPSKSLGYFLACLLVVGLARRPGVFFG